MAENTRENKMGTMPIGKLLANMAGPVMISMLFQALYNIVDSVFVARLSQDAMNAVSLAFPLQTLCIAPDQRDAHRLTRHPQPRAMLRHGRTCSDQHQMFHHHPMQRRDSAELKPGSRQALKPGCSG